MNGKAKSTKVTTATKTGNHLIRIFASHRHLLLCLQSDDGLVQSHMVQNGTQGVFTARSGGSRAPLPRKWQYPENLDGVGRG